MASEIYLCHGHYSLKNNYGMCSFCHLVAIITGNGAWVTLHVKMTCDKALTYIIGALLHLHVLSSMRQRACADLCVPLSGEEAVFWSAAMNRVSGELGNLKSNEQSEEARPPTTVGVYSKREQGGIEYELCPRCWQT